MVGQPRFFIVAALLLAVGCGAVASRSMTTLFRPSRQMTSWEKTLNERTRIPFRDPVLTPADLIPTLRMRRLEPRHPERFTKRANFDELIAPRPGKISRPPASDDVQLAASLKWLDEEFGLPSEVEIHRGLMKDMNGADPHQVYLMGYYHGLALPLRALVRLDGEQVVEAMVCLISVSEIEGTARPVVEVELAREAAANWFRSMDHDSTSRVSERLWPVKHCHLEFGRPSLPGGDGRDDELVPLWHCDGQGAIPVDAYEGTAFRPREVID